MCAVAPSHKLKIVGLKSKWFTVSPHPDFRILLIDPATGNQSAPPPATSWRINITASNGFGKLDAGILDPDATSFPVDSCGVAFITGLKYRKVTSQEGQHFVCHFSVAAVPSISVDSGHLNVRCQRMKCEGKADDADLVPDDPIGRVKGIGKGYSRKFKALGYHTLRDLLGIDTSTAGRPARLALLAQIRQGRGALTEAKMVRLLQLSRRVCSKTGAAVPAAGMDALAALSSDTATWPDAAPTMGSSAAPADVGTLEFYSATRTCTTTTTVMSSIQTPTSCTAEDAVGMVDPYTSMLNPDYFDDA